MTGNRVLARLVSKLQIESSIRELGGDIGVLCILVIGRRPAFLLLNGDAALCCCGGESRLSTDNCTSPLLL